MVSQDASEIISAPTTPKFNVALKGFHGEQGFVDMMKEALEQVRNEQKAELDIVRQELLSLRGEDMLALQEAIGSLSEAMRGRDQRLDGCGDGVHSNRLEALEAACTEMAALTAQHDELFQQVGPLSDRISAQEKLTHGLSSDLEISHVKVAAADVQAPFGRLAEELSSRLEALEAALPVLETSFKEVHEACGEMAAASECFRSDGTSRQDTAAAIEQAQRADKLAQDVQLQLQAMEASLAEQRASLLAAGAALPTADADQVKAWSFEAFQEASYDLQERIRALEDKAQSDKPTSVAAPVSHQVQDLADGIQDLSRELLLQLQTLQAAQASSTGELSRVWSAMDEVRGSCSAGGSVGVELQEAASQTIDTLRVRLQELERHSLAERVDDLEAVMRHIANNSGGLAGSRSGSAVKLPGGSANVDAIREKNDVEAEINQKAGAVAARLQAQISNAELHAANQGAQKRSTSTPSLAHSDSLRERLQGLVDLVKNAVNSPPSPGRHQDQQAVPARDQALREPSQHNKVNGVRSHCRSGPSQGSIVDYEQRAASGRWQSPGGMKSCPAVPAAVRVISPRSTPAAQTRSVLASPRVASRFTCGTLASPPMSRAMSPSRAPLSPSRAAHQVASAAQYGDPAHHVSAAQRTSSRKSSPSAGMKLHSWSTGSFATAQDIAPRPYTALGPVDQSAPAAVYGQAVMAPMQQGVFMMPTAPQVASGMPPQWQM